ncbi:MAG TPA: ABC transporter substrate-binding protein [Solirubrobacterales bacterium]|nr:ABC transporter substrate-binding protein [Solirubrobacterales bacterium]
MSRVVFEIEAMPTTLAAAEVHEYVGWWLAEALHDPLFAESPVAGEVEGAICAAAREGESGLEWDLDIAESARWQDGAPITAADVARAISRQSARPGGSWLAEPIAAVEERGPQGLRVLLRRPFATLPQLLSAPIFAPEATSPEHPDGDRRSGPYRLRGALSGRRGLVLEAVPAARRFRRDGPPEIVLLKTDSPQQGVRLLADGTIDATCPTSIAREQLDGDAPTARRPIAMAVELVPNPSGRLSAPEARQALLRALDRGALGAAVDGVMQPLASYDELWREEDAGDPRVDPHHDPAAASRVWRSFRPPPLATIDYPDFPPNRELVAAVTEQLEAVLGLRTVGRPIDYGRYLGQRPSAGADLHLVLTAAPWPDPTGMLAPFRRGGPLARELDYGDTRFDVALEQAERLPERSRRLDACRRAHELLLRSAPAIPLLAVEAISFVSPRLQGLRFLPSGRIRFEELSIAAVVPNEQQPATL